MFKFAYKQVQTWQSRVLDHLLQQLTYIYLLHIYECYTVKYATRRFHMKLYYIDMSALPKNRQLVFSVRNYIRDRSEIFSISSLVKISLMSFLCFSSSFFLFSKHSYLCNKKKIARWLERMKFIFLWKKDFTCSLLLLMKYFFHSKINFICLRHSVISSIY